jgi:hypothetical protein
MMEEQKPILVREKIKLPIHVRIKLPFMRTWFFFKHFRSRRTEIVYVNNCDPFIDCPYQEEMATERWKLKELLGEASATIDELVNAIEYNSGLTNKDYSDYKAFADKLLEVSK